MNTLIIEINDFELTLIQGRHHINELGCALVSDEDVLFGELAWQQAKTSPLNMYYHYWQRLGYEEVNTVNSQINHFADLAYIQLQRLTADFHNSLNIIFVVPPYYNNEQLSLLLGIAKACDLSVSAIVNNAVAYLAGASYNYNDQSAVLIDIELNQTTCTELVTNSILSVKQNHVVAEQGVHDLYRIMAKWINEKLVKECRFDGFYTAETEQEIYQKIPNLLKLAKDQYDISIADRNIMISINEVREKLDDFFKASLNNLPSANQYFITRRFANFLERLTINSEQDFIVVDKHALASNINKKFDVLTSDKDIRLITQLPLNHKNKDDINTELHGNIKVNKASVITHLLINGCAYPFEYTGEISDEKQYYLSVQPPYITLERTEQSIITVINSHQCWRIENHNSQNVYLNELPLEHFHELVVGDQITSSLLDKTMQFIHVKKDS